MGSDPYASLEPSTPDPAHAPRFPEVGATITLVRGFRKRCPRCGERDTFVSWFQIRTACPRCELRFAKEEGGFLGAMTLNYVVAIGIWLVVLVAGIVLTVPGVADHVPLRERQQEPMDRHRDPHDGFAGPYAAGARHEPCVVPLRVVGGD